MFRVDRRKLLSWSLQLPVALVCGKAAAAACTNPDEWSDSEHGTRESLEYTDTAPDPQKACSGCQYFQRETTSAACGTCEILSGAADANGHCVSWTKRS